MMSDPIELIRREKRARVRAAQRRVTAAETNLQKAIADRDAVLIAAHGLKRDGGLSYADLAAETGLSKGRVIQIVQPTRTAKESA